MVKRSAVTENKFAGLSLRSGTHRVNPIFKKIFARYTIYLCNNINYTQQEPRPRKGQKMSPALPRVVCTQLEQTGTQFPFRKMEATAKDLQESFF